MNCKELLGTVCLLLLCVYGSTAAENVSAWKPIKNACLCKEFRCKDGLFCLHSERVCNGSKDCPGGEDETRELDGITTKCKRGSKANCTSDEFKCKFGDCVKLTQVCDGKIDCWGGVDEAIDFCTWVNSRRK